jgi:hypothetical protein
VCREYKKGEQMGRDPTPFNDSADDLKYASLGGHPAVRGGIPWRRVMPIGTVLLALLLVAIIIVRYLVPNPPTIPSQNSVPLTRLASGPMNVSSNVSSGTLLINGKAVPYASGPITLRRGLNHIEMDAPPFNPLVCSVEWPQVLTATPLPATGVCPIEHVRNGTPVILLGFGSSNLPPAIAASAIAAIQQAFADATMTTVAEAGAHYGTGSVTANGVPITKTFLDPQHVSMTTHYLSSASVCGQDICPLFQREIPIDVSQQNWQVVIPTLSLWQFTSTRTGATIITPEDPYGMHTFIPGNAGQPPLDSPLLGGVVMSLNFSGTSWRVDLSNIFADGTLFPSEEILSATCDDFLNLALSIPANQRMEYKDYGGTTQGCLIWGPVSSPNPAQYIERFGALLAANAVAHAAQPSLPMATPAELAAVGNFPG